MTLTGHNPVPGWGPSRIDQGVDGNLSLEGFIAPFDVRVALSITHSAGWGGGGYMALEILSGPLTGQYLFAAEGILPLLFSGQTASAGTRIAARANNPINNAFGNIETGFAAQVNPGRPLAQMIPGYAGDQSLQAITAGSAANEMIVQLGGAPGHNNTNLAPDYSLLPQQIRDALWPPPAPSGLPLKEGSTGAQVQQVQKALNARGFSLTTDGIYGPATAGAVKVWQGKHKRKVTGEVNQSDWDFMFPTLSIKIGLHRLRAIEALQLVLDQHGYSLTQDGKFGPATDGAVKQFQRQHGLTSDGIVGDQTWHTLFTT